MRGVRKDGVVRALAVLAAILVIALGTWAGLQQPGEDPFEDGVPGDEQPQDGGYGDGEPGSSDSEAGDAARQAPTEDLSIATPDADTSDIVDAIDRYLDENVGLTGEPGLAIAVVDAEGPLLERTFGDCTSVHDTFVIGSLSKSFTALCVMQLAEQGLVDLDAPASTYVDAPAVPDSVTLRSLLNQTSGFGYYEALSEARVGASQGSFSYANANYDLLGKVVERVSGEPYARYLEEHVLALLGMNDSSAEVAARAEALGHRNYFGLDVADGYVHQDGDAAWGQAPSGYVCSSVDDMARYLEMYLNLGSASPGSATRVLSADGIRDLFLSRVPDPGGDTFYGMGWTSYYLGTDELVLSHDGQVENGVARMCLLPDRGIGIVIMADSSDYYGGNQEFYDLADGVVAIASGGWAEPVDPSVRLAGHVRQDALLGLVALLALAPIIFFRNWKRGLAVTPLHEEILRIVVVHAGLPLALLAEPLAMGYRWRDVAAFVPDAALVLAGSAALLVATGIVKAVKLAQKPA